MTKKELQQKMLERFPELNSEENEFLLNSIFEYMTKTLVSDHEFNIKNYGKLAIKDKKTRKGVNPSTGETIILPASRTIKFKMRKSFKEELNSK